MGYSSSVKGKYVDGKEMKILKECFRIYISSEQNPLNDQYNLQNSRVQLKFLLVSSGRHETSLCFKNQTIIMSDIAKYLCFERKVYVYNTLVERLIAPKL